MNDDSGRAKKAGGSGAAGTLAALLARLDVLYRRTVETPVFNPVAQLGLELSRRLEGGECDLADMAGLIEALYEDAFARRAEHLRSLLEPLDREENRDRLVRLFTHLARQRSVEEFAALWRHPLIGLVFTAHPTFMMDENGYAALAARVEGHAKAGQARCEEGAGTAITITREHAAAVATMGRAMDAGKAVLAAALEAARAVYGDKAPAIATAPVYLNTWVGYDMDGRTDIGWPVSIRFRLIEKQRQLAWYENELGALNEQLPPAERGRLDDVGKRLAAGREHTERMIEAFSGPLREPAEISAAANALTANDDDKITSLEEIIAALEELAGDLGPGSAASIALSGLATMMRSQGLGIARVHFRINAAQLHNAFRGLAGDEEPLSFASRLALVRVREQLDKVRPARVNFAALAIENTTAVRQFIAIAEILKHIDRDQPVRLLIAECEHPATVLVAIYFARLFAIADKVDISPLFETAAALEHGERVLAALMEEPHYRDYVRGRGRLAVQTGFSDAGRFIGQIPASLAIERLQGNLARAMVDHDLGDVAALVFNTHGESMGRGAHPASVAARLAHTMSPWAVAQFTAHGIALEREVSLQGGDGFVLFGGDDMALAMTSRLVEALLGEDAGAANQDPFYRDIDASLDFYRAVRDYQDRLMAKPAYNHALTAFGLALTAPAGSRVSRRQSDVAMERDDGLRRIRAIPHNAILQQLGYPANVVAGIGEATAGDAERFVQLFAASPRARALLDLVARAKALSSIKALVAYGHLFDGAYWATRPYRGREGADANACLDLAERLAGDARATWFLKLATELRVDSLKLHRLLAALADGGGDDTAAGEQRRALGVLHGLRLALMQHLFLKAVALPAFARRNDISRDDIIDMVMELRVPEAVALLRDSFPVAAPRLGDFAVDEPGDYPRGEDAPRYRRIHARYIEPMEEAYRLIQRIGEAMAHHFGALG